MEIHVLGKWAEIGRQKSKGKREEVGQTFFLINIRFLDEMHHMPKNFSKNALNDMLRPLMQQGGV